MPKNNDAYKNRAKSLWKTFSKVQDILGLSDPELAEMLSLRLDEMIRFRSENKELSASNIFSIADSLHFSVENLWNNKIDYQALVESFQKNLTYIPEKYTYSAFAKRRTAITLIGFSEAAWGKSFVNLALNHFQVHPAAFHKPDEMINIRFITDFCTYLKQQGIALSRFHEMGRFSVNSNRGSALDKEIQKEKNARNIYERVFKDLVNVYFDKNWDYKMTHLSVDHALVSVEPRKEVLESLGEKDMGNHLLCLFKAGVTASLLEYKGLPDARVSHPKCRHHGDSECLYAIDFSEANFIQKRELRNFRKHPTLKDRQLF